MKIVIFGLSVSASWGNGHATLWGGLLTALAAKGHRIEPAAMSPHKSFLVCGAQFPEATQWPVNVRRTRRACGPVLFKPIHIEYHAARDGAVWLLPVGTIV